MRKNCWEVMDCCRDPKAGGDGPKEPCPAASAAEMDGTNQGSQGGRVCWYVAGTLCGGQRQGTFAEKQMSCLSCAFYQRVKREEGDQFRVKPVGHKHAKHRRG